MKKIPFATELISNRFPKHDGIFVLKNIEEFMIEFAKIHVKEALKQSKNIEVDGCGCGESTIIFEHIENCYPLENIK